MRIRRSAALRIAAATPYWCTTNASRSVSAWAAKFTARATGWQPGVAPASTRSRQASTSGDPITAAPISVSLLPVRTDMVRVSLESVPAHRRTSIWASGFGFDRDVAIVGVSVDRPFCTAEQSPRFVGSKIRNDVVARYELVADPFETVGLHDRRHHFAVNRKWYIDACALDQRGPVLIAESVSQFDTGAHGDLGRLRPQLIEMDCHHVA